jgi:hypothetical protein
VSFAAGVEVVALSAKLKEAIQEAGITGVKMS